MEQRSPLVVCVVTFITITTSMLIKIQAFPDGSGAISKTLHTCLATSNKENAGVICSVGRKNGDIIFPTDKSVSREHAKLRIVSRNHDDDGGQKPRNTEEIQACEKSEYGMCVVVENTGKGGSWIAVDKQPIAVNIDGDDSETDAGSDEETDDEGISQKPPTQASSTAAASQQSETPPLSTAVREFWGNKPAELKKMDDGMTEILPLSLDKNNRTILIQCGRFESTIKLTLMRIFVAFSGMSKKELKAFRSQVLPSIGGLGVEGEIPDYKTTYLVTKDRMAGAKQLIAWCYDIPMVPKTFLQAIADRTNPTDPLPNPNDFELENTESNDFWDQKADPNLLSNYTLLSIEDNEIEKLAIAAGAKCVALYNSDDYETAAQKCIDNGELCFAFSTRKKETKKLHSVMNVPLVSTKKLALAVSQQNKILPDDKGSPIVRDTPATEATPNFAEDGNKDEEKKAQPEEKDEKKKRDDVEERISSQSMSQQGRRESPRRLQKKQQEIENPDSPEMPRRKRKTKETKEVAEFDHSKINKEDESSGDEEDYTRGRTIKRRRRDDHDSSPQDKSRKKEPPIGFTKADISLSTLQEEDSLVRQEEENSMEVSRDHSIQEKPTETEKEALAPSSTTQIKDGQLLSSAADSSGWFTTAPKDDRLRKERRRRAERENRDDIFLPAAITEVVTTLINDRPPKRNPTSATSTSRSSSKRRTYTGPNFKKFRKNSIVKATKTEIYAVSAVLSKQTARQRRMDEDERALEEEERRADELFRGDGMGGTNKKRRRRT